jgi:hypothetical protein
LCLELLRSLDAYAVLTVVSGGSELLIFVPRRASERYRPLMSQITV